jgi:hypothetical protein
MNFYTKDPGATLDYGKSWADWLAEEGETATAITWIAPAGITIVAQNSNLETGLTTVRLSGGTLRQTYRVVSECAVESGEIERDSISVFIDYK